MELAKLLTLFWAAVSGLQLLAAAGWLFAIGFLVSRLVPRLWFLGEAGGFAAHRIFVGQLALVIWVYLRSLLNHLTGVVVPIGWIDWLGLLLLLAALVHRREGLRQTWQALAADRVEHAVALCAISVLLFFICRYEVPRLVMLSSDPDQHAFWARQIQRFGTLPYFSQLFWGPRDFDYPAGFAVMNFVWSSLSRLDVRDVVQVQTAVQTQLAALVLVEALSPGVVRDGRTAARRITALFLLFQTYYRFLPYGYQSPVYHLEGTGRTGSILFLAVALSFAVSVHRRVGDREALDRIDLLPNGLFAGAVLAGAGLINVANLPYYALPFFAGGLVLVAGRFSGRRVLAALSAVPVLGLILLDPYYLKRLFHPGDVYYKAAERVTAAPAPLAASYLSHLAGMLQHLGGSAAATFRTDLADARQTAVLMGVLAAGLVVLLLARAVAPRDALALGAVALAVFLARLLLFPLTEALQSRGPDFYLLVGYVEGGRQQVVVLWFYACLAVVYLGMAYRLKVPWLAAAAACVVMTLAVVQNDQILPLRRKGGVGGLGTATADDLAVIEGIEQMFRDYRRAQPPPSFERVPKILVPNELKEINGEHWLFPHGASRILPLYDVFPVAFFYFQGSSEYTYASYVAHVCERFDEAWLAERGMRYLFLPSEMGCPCIAGLGDVLGRSRVLLHQGQTLFVELPSAMR